MGRNCAVTNVTTLCLPLIKFDQKVCWVAPFVSVRRGRLHAVIMIQHIDETQMRRMPTTSGITGRHGVHARSCVCACACVCYTHLGGCCRLFGHQFEGKNLQRYAGGPHRDRTHNSSLRVSLSDTLVIPASSSSTDSLKINHLCLSHAGTFVCSNRSESVLIKGAHPQMESSVGMI